MKRFLIALFLTFMIASYSMAQSSIRLDGFTNDTTVDDADEFIFWNDGESAVRNINWDTIDTSVSGTWDDCTGGYCYNDGNVGIGTSTPGAQFQIGDTQYYFDTNIATQSEVQSALTALSEGSGGTVNIVGGGNPIELASALIIGSNTSLICSGASSGDHFKLANGANAYMVEHTNSATNFTIAGCSFDGNKDNQTNQVSAISLSNSAGGGSYFSIIDNKFHDQRVGGVTIRYGEKGIVSRNHFWNQGYSGLSGGSPIQCHGENQGEGLVGYCRDITISDNIIEDAQGHCIHVKWDGAHDVIIANNQIRGCSESGVLVGSTGDWSGASYNVTISNNHFSLTSTNADVINTFVAYNVNIVNNFVDHNNTASTSSYGVQLEQCRKCSVTGNYLMNGSTGVGIMANPSLYSKITDNYIQGYDDGIKFERAANYNIIAGNHITNFKRGISSRLDTNNNLIYGNILYDDKGGKVSERLFVFESSSGVNFLFNNTIKTANNSILPETTTYLPKQNYILNVSSTPAEITGDQSSFIGVANDKIKVTIDSVVYDDIDIASATSIRSVVTAINTALGANKYNAYISYNGNLAITSSTSGTTSNVTIADGTSTGSTVIARLFSVSGDRTKTGTSGYITTNINQQFNSNLSVVNNANGKDGLLFNLIIGPIKSYSEAINSLADGTTSVLGPYIDSTPAGEWVGTDADFVCGTSTTSYKSGTGSLEITRTSSSSIGDLCAFTPGSPLDWTDMTALGLWVKASAPGGSNLRILIYDSGGTTSTLSIGLTGSGGSNYWNWRNISLTGVTNANKDDITKIEIEANYEFVYSGATLLFDQMMVWKSSAEKTLSKLPITDGITSVVSIPTAAASDNAFTNKIEYTNYFIDYGTSNARLIPITDESANSWLINYQY